jgi:hypothetical protein
MHDLIARLSEQQIADIILLLEQQKMNQAQVMLEAQLQINSEQAEQILQEFAKQHNMALDLPQQALSPNDNQKMATLDSPASQAAFEVPAIGLVGEQNTGVKISKKKPNRILIGLVILILVILLGLIFG